MTKPNGLVEVSGDGLRSKKVLGRLKKFSQDYFTVVIVGGGSDINEEFEKRGYKTKFCPLGRITNTPEERQLARDILEKNQASFQDLLYSEGINAQVVIPFRDIGTVLCPENGDVMVLSAYIGFDKIVIFTKKNKVKEKRLWLKEIAHAFRHIEEGELDKIEVIGF